MIKYVIFDFDGTLVDSKDIAISVVNRLADKYHFKKLEYKDIEYLRGLSIIERCRYLHAPIYKIPFWAADFYHLYKESMKNLMLFDGVKELLDELNQKGYRIAIISSNAEHNIREFLQKKGIEYIQQIYCSNNIFGKDKIIKNFLRKYGLKLSEILYVGDEHRDIVACKRVGVKVVWVEWGFDVLDMVKQENPDYMARTPEEILHIVQSI